MHGGGLQLAVATCKPTRASSTDPGKVVDYVLNTSLYKRGRHSPIMEQ